MAVLVNELHKPLTSTEYVPASEVARDEILNVLLICPGITFPSFFQTNWGEVPDTVTDKFKTLPAHLV